MLIKIQQKVYCMGYGKNPVGLNLDKLGYILEDSLTKIK